MSFTHSEAMMNDRDAVGDQPRVAPDADSGSIDGSGDIRCPACAWTPAAHDRWTCRCLFTWNTFDTGGVCPNCLYQWAYTQCLACHGWSPHSQWYPK